MVMIGLAKWLSATRLNAFVNNYSWVWATLETLHFIGMSLLIGTVAVFDLRLLGMEKRLPIAALHRIVRWGILGFSINLVTGIMFLSGNPYSYIFNPAFQLKALFILLAGVNAVLFYLVGFRNPDALQAGADTPLHVKIIGGASLLLWVGVMVCGRVLPQFRPYGKLHPLF